MTQVCSKVTSYLAQGLDNLSWRFWHLQNIIIKSDNAKSKREFKKLFKAMGDKLDKVSELTLIFLPPFSRLKNKIYFAFGGISSSTHLIHCQTYLHSSSYLCPLRHAHHFGNTLNLMLSCPHPTSLLLLTSFSSDLNN